ncbi:MAG: hypothetical protein HDQ91_00745 [Desulfovibrio sp.]|nr:hypothetical protein [Desulfovibrio sp.]
MRFIASLILACCFASPAFAGQEFCQIANPASCVGHAEAQPNSGPAPDMIANQASRQNRISHPDAAPRSGYGEFAFLDLELSNPETPANPR